MPASLVLAGFRDMTSNTERCGVCDQRFRMDDAVGTLRDSLVHARCLPKAPRFPDDDADLDHVPPDDPAPRR